MSYESLAGKYETTAVALGETITVVFDFHVDGSTLTGTTTVDGHEAEITKGEITDAGFKYKTTLNSPMGKMLVSVVGQGTDEGIKGYIKVAIQKMEFEAKRVQE